MKSEDTPDTISLPESQDGNSPCNTPDGRTNNPFGPDRVPVSRFRALEKDRQRKIPVTCGPIFSDLSPSTDLQRSLENRLQALLVESGIPQSELILKPLTIQVGHPLSLLQLSGHPTTEKDCGGWQTPRARGDAGGAKRLERTGRLRNLEDQVRTTANWRTPGAVEGKRGSHKNLDSLKERIAIGRQLNLWDQVFHTWPTPVASQQKEAGGTSKGKGYSLYEKASSTGTTTNTDSVKSMENTGQLSPAFLCWLMGFPEEWVRCADLATP